MHSRKWLSLVGCGALAVGVLAGCAKPTAGTAEPDPAAIQRIQTGPLNAKAVFGDFTSVDPCSVVTPGMLPAADHAKADPPDAFDDCTVSVTINGVQTDVSVGPLSIPTLRTNQLKQVKELRRGLKLMADEQSSADQGYCNSYIRFSDGLELEIYAAPHDSSSRADVCPAAQQVAEAVANHMGFDSVKHRTWPANSVGSLDPCKIVDQQAAKAAINAALPAMDYPEHHQCEWLGVPPPPLGVRVRLEFLIGTQPAVSSPTADSMIQIAGRTTEQSSYPGGTPTTGTCYLQLGLAPYGPPSQHLVELAVVDAHNGSAASTAAAPCDEAKALAALVWPKLPQGS